MTLTYAFTNAPSKAVYNYTLETATNWGVAFVKMQKNYVV